MRKNDRDLFRGIFRCLRRVSLNSPCPVKVRCRNIPVNKADKWRLDPKFFRTQILYFLRLKSSWYANIIGFYNAPISGSVSDNYFKHYIVLLPRWSGFDSTSFYVRSVFERVALGQVFLRVLWFFPCQYHSANILYSFIHSIELSSTTLQNLGNWQHH